MLCRCILGMGLLCSAPGFSQATEHDSVVAKEDFFESYYIRFEEDSVFYNAIALDEVYLFGNLEFASQAEKLRYYILKRKTLKVYPYAKLAAERLMALNDSLAHIKKKRQRKKYIRKMHQYVKEEFSEQLKKLTRTEGQILIKLIHRQTGETTFTLVKELRGGWRAFWYNFTASVYNINIKETFRPKEIHEDYLIEDILQRAFAANRLEQQASVLNYDYAQLSNHWKNNAGKKN